MATQPGAKRRKPPKPTAATLTGLGAERLAELLVAAARSNTGLKRTLTSEVVQDAADICDEADRQIQRIRTGKGRLNVTRSVVLARELDQLSAAISAKLGDLAPAAGAERLLNLLDAAPGVLGRRTGEARPVLDAFAAVGCRIAALCALAPEADRAALLERICCMTLGEAREAAPELVVQVAAAVGSEGRETLRRLVEAELATLERSGARSGVLAQRTQVLTQALAQIADAAGDVDAYQSAQERRDPRLRDHLGLAERLVAAGRAAAALEVLVATPAGLVRSGRRHAELRITALDALGRREEAQEERWALFCSALSVDALRGFLKRLPDFEDVDREETALAHAEQHQDLGAALAFLLAWPDHRRAAALVRRRAAALPGLDDVVLTAAANQLAYRDPLAATLLFRAGIDATLSRGKAGGYGRAAQSLLECEGLSAAVTDWELRPDHQTYLARLRSNHARQMRFWRRVAK